LGVIVLLVVGSVGVYLYTASPSTKSSSTNSSKASSNTSQSTSGSTWFKVEYDSLVVGYNSGLWQLKLDNVGPKNISELTATLNTPVQSKMCTSVFGGFSFGNCPATPPNGGSFAANATFAGYATGVGAGSAKPGQSYTVSVYAVFADGTSSNDTISVVAQAGS
jgi:hypothetical protein